MTDIALRQAAPVATVAADGMPAAAHALIDWARSADAAYSLADRLCATSFVPQQFKGKPVEAAAAMLAGSEVGLSPMASLRAFDVIQGVAAPRALTMRAIAQSQGHEFITDEATPSRVRMRGRRRGASEWQEVVWTIQRAQQLGLTGKDQWKKQPQTMLIARATTELVRLVAADAILGIGYSVEEIQDDAAETTTVVRATTPPARAQRKKAEPAPTPEPDLSPEPPADNLRSDAQMRKLWALAQESGMDESTFRAYLVEALGREVESTKTLTKAEAHHLIEELENPAREPEPDEDGVIDGELLPTTEA